ncbi:MAG: NADH-quinone oxidoreductase subunit N [Deltaproteobacteria bacterium]|nr:NADH-quinone oxidoreductase subunit N [Deltaproteobacteria bacterium]
MNTAIDSVSSFLFVTPELLLCGAAVVLFLLSAAARHPSPWQGIVFPLLAIGTSLAALAWLIWYGMGWQGQGILIFDGLVALDPMGLVFRALIMGVVAVAVMLSVGSPELPKSQRGEYHGLLMVMAAGMSFLVGANHLLMIYVAMETVSLCSYLLVGWNQAKPRSGEAGLKYVLYGGVASGIMLFGMSLLFGLFGDLSLPGLHKALAAPDAIPAGAASWTAWIAVSFVLVGFGFKVTAVPFHMWSPDAYEGAPTPFTALLSVGPKAAGFAVMLRFLWGIFAEPGSLQETLAVDLPWEIIIGVLAALSMTLGNLVALVQNNLKRMLAYSSIAHAGYILMGVVAGGHDGFESVTLYMGIYAMMNLGAFAVVAAVARSTGSEDMSAYRGLGKRAPWLALVMVIFLLSLTGLPPTAGFIGKLYLFAALLAHGGTWYLILAGLGIANSVIALYYYARVMKAMYLEQGDPDAKPVPALNAAGLVAGMMALPTLIFGIFFQPLAVLASWSAQIIR